MPTNHEPRSDDASRLPDLEPVAVAQDEAVKGGADASTTTTMTTACAESKGQIQGELARFR